MPLFSAGQKEAMVKKALDREPGCSLKSFAQEHHVGYSTLHRWLQCARSGNSLSSSYRRSGPSSSNKFKHVLATAKLADDEVGPYCRTNGIYHHDIQEWEQELMSDKEAKDKLKLRAELNELKALNKKLKKELRYKDKALAEASALLVLKKKADAIWGVREED